MNAGVSRAAYAAFVKRLATAIDVPVSDADSDETIIQLVSVRIGTLRSEADSIQSKDAEIARLRAALDALDCTHREGGDTRHCRALSPCLRCERDALRAELEAAQQLSSVAQATDRDSMEQLAHALGWKDGGPGWQAALDEIGRMRAERERLKPSGPVAEDVMAVKAVLHRAHERGGMIGPSHPIFVGAATVDPWDALSHLASQAQAAQVLAEALEAVRLLLACPDPRPNCGCAACGADAALSIVRKP